MNSISKKIKYPAASLFIILGIVIAYCSFYYATGFVKSLYFESTDEKNIYDYEYEVIYEVSVSASVDEIRNLFEAYDMTAAFTELLLYVDDTDATHLCKLYISTCNSGFPYELVAGSFPDLSVDYTENLVVLGKENKKYTTKIDGEDYIDICGETYRVTGYISSPNSSIYDFQVILFANALGDNCIQEFAAQTGDNDYSSMMGYLMLQSNEINITSWINENADLISNYLTVKGTVSDTIEFSTDVTDKNYTKYAYLLYAFSLAILVMIIRFWIMERKKEFVVRRIVGYDRMQIFKIIFKELGIEILVTTLILFIIQNFIIFISGEIVGMSVRLFNLLFMLLFIIVTFAVSIINPMYHIFTDDIDMNGEELA